MAKPAMTNDLRIFRVFVIILFVIIIIVLCRMWPVIMIMLRYVQIYASHREIILKLDT